MKFLPKMTAGETSSFIFMAGEVPQIPQIEDRLDSPEEVAAMQEFLYDRYELELGDVMQDAHQRSAFEQALRNGPNNSLYDQVSRGRLNLNFNVDGDFGPTSQLALAYLQYKHNQENGTEYDVDGRFGPQTRAILDALSTSHQAQTDLANDALMNQPMSMALAAQVIEQEFAGQNELNYPQFGFNVRNGRVVPTAGQEDLVQAFAYNALRQRNGSNYPENPELERVFWQAVNGERSPATNVDGVAGAPYMAIPNTADELYNPDYSQPGPHSEFVGATGSTYAPSAEALAANGAETGARLMNLQERRDRFYRSIGAFGEDLEGLADDLAALEEYNTANRSNEEIQAFMTDVVGVQEQEINGRPLLNWGFALGYVGRDLVTRPDSDQVDRIMAYLAGEPDVGSERNMTEEAVNQYAVSRLDQATDTEVMNFFFDEFAEDFDDIDRELWSSFLFGIFQEERGEFREVRNLVEQARTGRDGDRELSIEERQAAAMQAWEMMHAEFDEDVREARRGILTNSRHDFFATLNDNDYQIRVRYEGENDEIEVWEARPARRRSGELSGRGDYVALSEIDLGGMSESQFKAQVFAGMRNEIRNDRANSGSIEDMFTRGQAGRRVVQRFERAERNFEAVQAGLEEVQRDLIQANIAALRARGFTLYSLQHGPGRRVLSEVCTETFRSGRTRELNPTQIEGLLDAVLNQVRAEEEANRNQYLSDARTRFNPNPDNLTAVEQSNRAGNLYHGPDIIGMNNEQLSTISWDYLKTVTPIDNPVARDQRLSSAYLIADSFARQGYNFTDAEFSHMFRGLSTDQIGEVQGFEATNGVDLLNASANLSADERAAELRANDQVVRLNPVSRNETINYGGRAYNITLQYDIYMRAGCLNPLIIPNTESLTRVVEQLADDIVQDCQTSGTEVPGTIQAVADYIELPTGSASHEIQINVLPILLTLIGIAGGGGGGIIKVPEVPKVPGVPVF